MARQSPVQRRNGPYVPLSAHYPRDDAILALDATEDDLAEVLFTRSLAYCAGDPRLDGYISDIALQAGVVLRRRRQERVIKAAARLAELGIYVREGSGYRFRRWDKWNKTYAEIEGRRENDRLRKTGQHGSDEEPPPPEDREEPPDDSAWSPNGFHAESTGNPEGTPAESLGIPSRARAAASNATHSNATQRTSSTPQRNAAAATPPPGGTTPLPPDLPEPIKDLAARITAVGICVSWALDIEAQHVIAQAIIRCGTHRLVKQAKAAYRPDNPAASAKAFIPGWASMPAPRAPDTDSQIPCHHGDPDARKCALCRAEQPVAV